MADERLIEFVRENRVLYDLSHAKYMDSKYKNNLWNKIGAQIKLDGETCKARWNNIRDNYRKSLKKTDTKSGQKRINVKLYKYHEHLNFLKKYFIERKRKESVDPQEEDLELQEIENEEVNQTQNFAPNSTTPLADLATPTPTTSPNHVPTTSPNYVPTPSPDHVPTPSPSYAPTPSPSYVFTPSPSYVHISSPSHVPIPSPSHVPIPSPSHVPIPSPSHVPTLSQSHVYTPSFSKKKKGAKNVPQKTAASSLMEYVLQKNQASAELTQHPVDAFLNGIAPTLKSLNQYYVHLAKSEIFATVQKYELKMMAEQNVTLFPGVDLSNVSAGTVVLQTDRSSQSISLSNPTAGQVVQSQGNAPHVIQNDMSQSILNSTTLHNITDTTQVHHQNSLQDFVRNYSDTQ